MRGSTVSAVRGNKQKHNIMQVVSKYGSMRGSTQCSVCSCLDFVGFVWSSNIATPVATIGLTYTCISRRAVPIIVGNREHIKAVIWSAYTR